MSVLLTIIIPSFQQGNFLRVALQSIEEQFFKNYEVIIMDGGSKDNTSLVVEDFKHLPINFYSEPDKGIYDAMNKGISRSIGKFLYFMGCDDKLSGPNSLLSVFGDDKNLTYDFIYGNVIFTLDDSVYDGRFNKLKLISKNICHQAIFVKREVFTRIGNFDLKYRYLADWVFNMKCFSEPWIKKKYIDCVIAHYNNGGSSFSIQDFDFAKEKWLLDKQYFPFIIRILNNRAKVLVKYLLKYV